MKWILLTSLLVTNIYSLPLPYSKQDTINFLKKKEPKAIEFRTHYFMTIDEELKEMIKVKAEERSIDKLNFFELINKNSSSLKFSGKYKTIVKVLNGNESEAYGGSRYLYLRTKVSQNMNNGDYGKAFEYLLLVSRDYNLKYIDEDLINLAIVASKKALINNQSQEAYVISSLGLLISKTMIESYKNGKPEIELLNLKIKARNSLVRLGEFF